MLKNKQNAKRTMRLSAHYMLDNKCKGASMCYIITEGVGTMLSLLLSTRTFLDIGVMSTNHLDQKSKNVAQKIWLE